MSPPCELRSGPERILAAQEGDSRRGLPARQPRTPDQGPLARMEIHEAKRSSRPPRGRGPAAGLQRLRGRPARTRCGARGRGVHFPPEWAPHEAVWLGWSTNPQHHRVQIEMIQAMAPHVRIRLMVTTDLAKAQATQALEAAGIKREQAEFFTHAIPNVWIRDSGPRFLSDGRRLAVADFAWNAYGYPRELLVGSYNLMRRGSVAKDLAARLDLPVVSTAVVAEGGALDVSDAVILAYKGTALQRNPGVPLEEIEREYLRVYRKKKIVWLDQSPLADRMFSGPKLRNYFGDGANGHIDEYARFVNDSTIVIAQIDAQEADWDPLSRADH